MDSTAQTRRRRIILGLMSFGPPKEIAGRGITDLGEFNEALDLFGSYGYTEIDTARVYAGGKQEAFTGKSNWKRNGMKIGTKVQYPRKEGANNAEGVIESVEASLKDLQTNVIDTIYLHRPDRTVPFAETLQAINSLHRDGKILQFGLSNFTAFELAEVVMMCKYNNWLRPTVYQGIYNVLTRNIESELIPACRRYGLDVVVYNPIAGGLLSGKIKSSHIIPAAGSFSDQWPIGIHYRTRYFRQHMFQALEVIEKTTEKLGLTMVETALRWALYHSKLKAASGNDGLVIGASSKAQLESNLIAVEKGPLPDEMLEALDRAWELCKVHCGNYWHGDPVYSYNTLEVLFGEKAK